MGLNMAELRLLCDRLTETAPRNTRHALECDWKHFQSWCLAAGKRPLPAAADTVRCYAAHCAAELQHRMSTIERRMWAIARMHKGAGHPSPVNADVRAVLRGLAVERGREQHRKEALTVPELRRMVATLDGRTFAGARDRCILLVGFSTGLRSADLAALELRDVRILRKRAEIHVRRENNDQEGRRGRVIGILRGSGSLDAVAALEQWLRKRRPKYGLGPGLLFHISSRWIWGVVKAAAKAAGLDPSRFGAHSLRAGMITALDAAGVSLPAIMERSGHRSYAIAARYVRHRKAFDLDPLAPKTGTRR
jgi:integrase